MKTNSTPTLEDIEGVLEALAWTDDNHQQYICQKAIADIQAIREAVPDLSVLDPETDQFHFSSGVHKTVYQAALLLHTITGGGDD